MNLLLSGFICYSRENENELAIMGTEAYLGPYQKSMLKVPDDYEPLSIFTKKAPSYLCTLCVPFF